MSVAYSHIGPLRTAGKTPSEIAEILTARTVTPILLSDLENWLDFANLAERGLSGAWEGPLVDVATNQALPAELRDGVTDLFKHVNKGRSQAIDTTDAQWAVAAQGLLVALVQIGVLTAAGVEQFHSLGGGLLYPDGVAELEVVEAIEAYDADEAAAVAQLSLQQAVADGLNTLVHPYVALGNRTAVVAGLRQLADTVEAG